MTKPPLGAVFETVPVPAELGYPAGSAVTIRVNPTKGQWRTWNEASDPNVPENETAAGRKEREARVEGQMIASLTALYQTTTALPGFDFSTEAATKATWKRDDVPDELWLFLLQLPWIIVAKRREAILKNGYGSSENQTSTTD